MEKIKTDKLLMIIAAGEQQLPVITKAKKMGLKILAVDANPNASGFKIADFYKVIDIKDKKANLKLARGFGIDGVMSIVCEPAIRTVSYIAEQLNLPGLNYNVAVATTDKGFMREKWFRAGLPSPKFFVIHTKEEAISTMSKLKLPVVIKPTDNAGSRGVTRIEKIEDLDFSFDLAKENSRSGRIIIEEFIEGIEMTVEALSYKNQHYILGISRKRHYSFPYRIASGQTYPSGFPKEDELEVKKLVRGMLDTLGINMGPSHSEVMMAKEGPVPVEIGARGCGFKGFSDIVPFISGVDIVKECINIAMGYNVKISPKYSRAANLQFLKLSQGKLVRIEGLEKARKIKGVHAIELDVSAGDTINPVTNDGSRHGLIITFGNTREEVFYKTKQVKDTLKFHIVEK